MLIKFRTSQNGHNKFAPGGSICLGFGEWVGAEKQKPPHVGLCKAQAACRKVCTTPWKIRPQHHHPLLTSVN